MSLLMQALKKAERSRQSGLPEEPETGKDDDWGLEPLGAADGPPAGMPSAATPSAGADAATPVPPRAAPADGTREPTLELSLEPLDGEPAAPVSPAAPATAPANTQANNQANNQANMQANMQADTFVPPPAPAAAPPRAARPERPIPLEPALEAVHDPVPPQARHEPARARATGSASPQAAPRAPETPPRPAGTARARAVAAPAERGGIDMARLRIAGLSGILVIVLATFGYVYWRATSAPGPGASLPMVPMPPPSATGATGIAVAPAGPPFGPVSADAGSALPADGGATVPGQQAATATEPVPLPGQQTAQVPTEPPPSGPPPAPRTAAIAPTPAQLATAADPATRREAEREALERSAREAMAGAPPASPSAPSAATGPSYADAAQGGAALPVGAAGDIHFARATSAAHVQPAVQAGYAAFTANDFATARTQYDAALRQDPNNRDALLGSAAVALRENRGPEAGAAYARLLELNPQDADALAGMIALRPGDLGNSEAKLRGILRTRPDAAPVHFALGNVYARQQRWQEAQQAFFRAWTAAPANADYAFNLAVGLDRLNQGRLAADYYRRALGLSAGVPVSFDRGAAQRRLQELDAAAAHAAVPAPGAVAPAATLPPAAGN